jgi:DUF971 family protein
MLRPWPAELTFDRSNRVLAVRFDDGAAAELPFELLRVESPSAEVQGHGGQRQIVPGKAMVNVRDALPVGRYAVRIVFDDGHESGIYTWDFLYALGQERDARMAAYLAALADRGLSRV